MIAKAAARRAAAHFQSMLEVREAQKYEIQAVA